MEFAPFLDFSPTKRRDGWLASPEKTAFAQADGKDFSGISLMFPSTDAREILTEKAASRRNFRRFPKARRPGNEDRGGLHLLVVGERILFLTKPLCGLDWKLTFHVPLSRRPAVGRSWD
jgi:hypothetical protein